jgi:hypothetical protein
LHGDGECYGYGQSASECDGHTVSIDDLCWHKFHNHSDWWWNICVEHRPDDGLYHGFTCGDDDLHGYSYEYDDRLHEDCDGDSDGEQQPIPDGKCCTIDYLRRSEHDDYGNWRRHLLMEHWPDDGFVYSIPDHDDHLYGDGVLGHRLFCYSKRNGYGQSASCCDGERDPIDYLRWSEHDGYCHWWRHICVERWPDDGLVHGNTHDHDDLHGHRYKR